MIMEGRTRYNYDFSGKSVLVVEDTIMSFKLMKALLSRVNVVVSHASDGQHAIDLCSGDQYFDLVIMDLQMPEVNGLEATIAIKKLRPDLPVIAATANTFEDEEQACRQAGCSAYMTKPLQFNKLFQFMEELFEAAN